MPRKDAYYFSHDSNAQDDPKCMVLIDQLGMEGYGIFWALIERLRNEANYRLPLNVVAALSKRWCTSKEKVEAVIKNYDLFVVENDCFFSKRLEVSMNMKTERARLSASYRWGDAAASDRIANGVRNDANKGKEKKEKKRLLGISFSADSSEVIFSDKTKQKLGESQRHELEQGRLLPRQVVKGNIY